MQQTTSNVRVEQTQTWTAVTISKLLYGCHITVPGLQMRGILDYIQNVTYRATKRIGKISATAPKYITNGITKLESVEGALTRRAICTQAKYRTTTYIPLRKGRNLESPNGRAPVVGDYIKSFT